MMSMDVVRPPCFRPTRFEDEGRVIVPAGPGGVAPPTRQLSDRR
jgi:hypothetical protein